MKTGSIVLFLLVVLAGVVYLQFFSGIRTIEAVENAKAAGEEDVSFQLKDVEVTWVGLDDTLTVKNDFGHNMWTIQVTDGEYYGNIYYNQVVYEGMQVGDRLTISGAVATIKVFGLGQSTARVALATEIEVLSRAE